MENDILNELIIKKEREELLKGKTEKEIEIYKKIENLNPRQRELLELAKSFWKSPEGRKAIRRARLR